MKDKTLYWILGIGMVYFIVRFAMNYSSSKKENVAKNTDFKTGKCSYCGADMKFYSNELNTTYACSNHDCPSKQ